MRGRCAAGRGMAAARIMMVSASSAAAATAPACTGCRSDPVLVPWIQEAFVDGEHEFLQIQTNGLEQY